MNPDTIVRKWTRDEANKKDVGVCTCGFRVVVYDYDRMTMTTTRAHELLDHPCKANLEKQAMPLGRDLVERDS